MNFFEHSNRTRVRLPPGPLLREQLLLPFFKTRQIQMPSARRNRLQELIYECYRELYREAEPSANFDELLEAAPLDEWGRKVIQYNDYYLPREKFESIANKHKNKMKMNNMEEHSYEFMVYLGATPTCKRKEQ